MSQGQVDKTDGSCNPYNWLHSMFPSFFLSRSNLSFLTQCKYLGHFIEDTLYDDSDINRELRCLFTRANVFNRRLCCCLVDMKLQLFRTFCLYFYYSGLWNCYYVGMMNKLDAA